MKAWYGRVCLVVAMSQVVSGVYGSTSSIKNGADKPAGAKENFELFSIDAQEVRKHIVALVKKAVDYFMKHRNEEAFYAFLNDRSFIWGDVSIFVDDMDGTAYVQGPDLLVNIWGNFKDFKNEHGLAVVDLVLDKAKKGGGWVEYYWQGGYKSSYVELVEKNGVKYAIGAGWYSAAKDLMVENLVKSAAAYFYEKGKDQAFTKISNKVGEFVKGDMYLFVYDFKGRCFAHGDNTSLIGRDLINLKDDAGMLLIQALLEKAKKGGGWVSYAWKGAPKVSYVEKVKDSSGEYMIGAGYYPETKPDTMVGLVKKGVKYFTAWGREKAVSKFNLKVSEFVYGDSGLFMIDADGTMLANSENPDFVGQNLMALQSSRGDFIFKNIIALGQQGGGWISYPWKQNFIVTYVEKVSDKQGTYFIGAGFYPDSKRERILELVQKGIGYMRFNPLHRTMHEFARRGSPFIQGDLQLFVFNMDGDCLVYGDNYPLTWKNFKGFKDSDGTPVFKLFMNKAKMGGGWVEYASKNRRKIAYVETIEKDGKQYLIGSAFYR